MANPPTPAQKRVETRLADADTVDGLFRIILGRTLENEQVRGEVHNFGSVEYWVERLVNSDEFKHRFCERNGIEPRARDYIDDAEFRVPSIQSHGSPSSVLLIGSCMTEPWRDTLEARYPGLSVRHQLFNNASDLETVSDRDLAKVDFQIVQIPLRSLIDESEYFGNQLSPDGDARLRETFSRSVERLQRNLDAALKYNRSARLPAFVLNFAVPQINPLGLLLPKYDISNVCHYVSELNRMLSEMIDKLDSVYMIDFDQITAALGKRYILDDVTTTWNHGSFIGPTNTEDDTYLTPHGSISDIFAPKTKQATLAVFNECLASFRVAFSSRKIKMVIFDLDGTLWRGVPADRDDIGNHLTEGWPIGILEAAAFLRKRGILLSIVSRNDADTATGIWNTLYGKRFPLSNFANVKFQWGAKTETVATIIAETNILPANCLFVDDNPMEREQMTLAFPDMQIIDGPIFTWRRTLLWAVELQVPYVTDEGNLRSGSMQSMMVRDSLIKTLDEDQYLRDLNVEVTLDRLTSMAAQKSRRVIELLNKTNQFNTTGRRWTSPEIEKYLDEAGNILFCNVSDRLSDYGMTAIMLYTETECTQLVMSCRVFNLHVEFVLFDRFLSLSKPDRPRSVRFEQTGKNGLCSSFLARIGLDVSLGAATAGGASIPLPAGFRVPANLVSSVRVSHV